jgi:hypothetical protein
MAEGFGALVEKCWEEKPEFQWNKNSLGGYVSHKSHNSCAHIILRNKLRANLLARQFL